MPGASYVKVIINWQIDFSAYYDRRRRVVVSFCFYFYLKMLCLDVDMNQSMTKSIDVNQSIRQLDRSSLNVMKEIDLFLRTP